MFVVLDTNHYNELANDSVLGRNAQRRIERHQADLFITVISVQESVQGWMALINRKRPGREQIHAYARFQQCIEALTRLTILPFDESAARLFENLKRQGLRCGTMDLKIASICLVHDGLLLTRNLSDFQKVPELRVENWLD
jgi:tRNA(fMet)-specific endonuclease VapC